LSDSSDKMIALIPTVVTAGIVGRIAERAFKAPAKKKKRRRSKKMAKKKAKKKK